MERYLPCIGVAGRGQSAGLGSAMLRHRLERADADGLPTYLEASSPRGGRLNWRSADPSVFHAIKECFAGDFTDEEVSRLLNMLEPDETATIPISEARGEAHTWGRIPRTYVRFTLDRLIPPALQDRFIAEADRLTPDNPTDVRSVAAPHVGPFDRPELVDIFSDLVTR